MDAPNDWRLVVDMVDVGWWTLPMVDWHLLMIPTVDRCLWMWWMSVDGSF